MNLHFEINVHLYNNWKQPIVKGTYEIELSATDDADNEANAKRMADQMISELFQKHREKKK